MMNEYDVVVIGAGAAGIAAAQYAARANVSVVVLEREATGGQCNLISDLENYPGIPEPIDGNEFIERFERQARAFGAVFEERDVTGIEPMGDRWRVATDDGDIAAGAIILATGAAHRHLDIPGEREFAGRGVSYCAACDGPMFAGKRILVVGGGDAAMDEAMFLAKLTDDVVLIHRRDRFRAQGALVRRVMDHPSISVRTGVVAREIHGAPGPFGIDVVASVDLETVETGERHTERFDAVFIFVGSDPQTDLVPFVERDASGYVVVNEEMETSAPGLYAVGDVRVTPFRQLVVAAADGAIAAHAAARHVDAIASRRAAEAPSR